MSRRFFQTAAASLPAFFLLAAPVPSAADEAATAAEACAAVERAVRVLGEAERFHTKLLAQTPGRRRPVREERFVLGDVVYANSPAAGRWVKLPMTPEDRRSLSAAVAARPPRDCLEEGAAKVDGVETRVYAYSQDLPRQDGGAASEARGRLWVGASDGRPRRYEGRHNEVSVVLTFDYDAVAPPFGEK